MGLDDSTLIWNRSTRYRPRPTLLDIGLGPLYSHWLRLALLDISWGSLYSTSDQARSTQYWPGPNQSISARACSTRPWPRLIHPGLDDSTSVGRSARYPLEPPRLNNSSVSPQARMTRHWPWPRRLNISPSLDDLALVWALSAWHRDERLDIRLGPNDSTSIWARSTRPRGGPSRLYIAKARSTRHRPRPALLNIGSSPLYSTSSQARSTWHWPSLNESTSTLAQATRPRPGRLTTSTRST